MPSRHHERHRVYNHLHVPAGSRPSNGKVRAARQDGAGVEVKRVRKPFNPDRSVREAPVEIRWLRSINDPHQRYKFLQQSG
jgi:hypothetical protein